MKKPWTTKRGEIREVTDEIVAMMRPDPIFAARVAEEKRKRGRPQGRNKSVVSVSLDTDIVKYLRSTGQGWQSRLNDLVRAAVGLQS